MKDAIFNIVSILAQVAYFVPIVIVLGRKMWKEIPFLLFGLYWMISGLVNLLGNIPGISNEILEISTVVYNMIDVPMVLGILYVTTKSASLRRSISWAAPGFLVVQMLNFLIRGWSYDAAKYLLAIGILLVLIALLWEISLFMQKLEHNDHDRAMIFIHFSLLFAYGTFVIIYIFDYYITAASGSEDNFLIYYISSIVAIIIASVGYLTKKRGSRFAA